jgi:hypothetical protein
VSPTVQNHIHLDDARSMYICMASDSPGERISIGMPSSKNSCAMYDAGTTRQYRAVDIGKMLAVLGVQI